MNETGVQTVAEVVPGQTQWQRVTNIFTAPSKTFEDIKRGHRSWWMPLLIVSLFAYLFGGVVTTKIGIHQVVDNQMHLSAKTQEQMEQATPEQREKITNFWVGLTSIMFIANPAVTSWLVCSVVAGLAGNHQLHLRRR